MKSTESQQEEVLSLVCGLEASFSDYMQTLKHRLSVLPGHLSGVILTKSGKKIPFFSKTLL